MYHIAPQLCYDWLYVAYIHSHIYIYICTHDIYIYIYIYRTRKRHHIIGYIFAVFVLSFYLFTIAWVHGFARQRTPAISWYRNLFIDYRYASRVTWPKRKLEPACIRLITTLQDTSPAYIVQWHMCTLTQINSNIGYLFLSGNIHLISQHNLVYMNSYIHIT